MTVELKPGSAEWLSTITASKISAILGISRFQSQFSLWHQMAGNVEPTQISESTQEMFDMGHAAELAARHFWLLRNPGWRASQGEVQYVRDDLGFPAVATIDRRASRGRARRIVEVKAPRSLEDFGDDGSGEIPADHAAQITWQMFVSGIHDADLVAWPVYGPPKIYHVEWDQDLADLILQHVCLWVASLSAGTPPELDDSVTTYATVRALHPDIERDAEVELDEVLAVEYLTATTKSKALDKELRGLKTRVLDAMGNAQRATCGGRPIARRQGVKSVSLVCTSSMEAFSENLE
ncbi:MAG: YqaJ viral recombinase family protein [Rhodococcus sp. (in: high G+C Gram-positive bacteria)]|uniref:YqaJ viral recombinase family protein n=1 Tax=Rhodococcus sp. TaxID=1831 RepID=UPI003BB7CA3E